METMSKLRSKIDYNTIDNIRSFISSYDRETDSLIIQPKTPIPAISVDWGGDLWVRVAPDSGEIVGIEIEDYKEFFSKKYHTLLRGISVTNPIIKEIIITLLGLGAKPFTKRDFTSDLKRVCQRLVA